MKKREYIEYGKKEWVTSTNGILLILGISGVGKSTHSQEMGKKHGCTQIINLDCLKYDNPAKYEYIEILETFIREKGYIKTRQRLKRNKDYAELDKIFREFIDYPCEQQEEGRIILEGTLLSRIENIEYIRTKERQVSAEIIKMNPYIAGLYISRRGLARRELSILGRIKFYIRVYFKTLPKNIHRTKKQGNL